MIHRQGQSRPQHTLSDYQKTVRNLKKHYPYYFMMLPGIVFFIVYKYVPMYGIQLAFKDFKIGSGITGSNWLNPWYGHFQTFFQSTYCARLLKNTMVISIVKLALSSVFTVGFALLLSECKTPRYKRFVQTVSYMPHFLSWVVIYGIVYLFCSESSGYINRVLITFGKDPVPIMTSNTYFKGLLYFTEIWKNTGYSSIIYLAVIISIDPTLFEAAMVDGAGRLDRIWHITLPAIRGTFIMLTILNIGKVMNAGFDQVFIFYSPQVYASGDIIDTYVYRAGLEDMRFSLSTAVGLFKNVIGFILVYSTNRIASKWGEGIW